MRSLLLGAVAIVISGCAAKSAPNNESAGAPPPTRMFGMASSDPSAKPLWGVRAFDEKPGWLAAHPSLAKSPDGVWREKMQRAVEAALDARGMDARSLPEGVT